MSCGFSTRELLLEITKSQGFQRAYIGEYPFPRRTFRVELIVGSVVFFRRGENRSNRGKLLGAWTRTNTRIPTQTDKWSRRRDLNSCHSRGRRLLSKLRNPIVELIKVRLTLCDSVYFPFQHVTIKLPRCHVHSGIIHRHHNLYPFLEGQATVNNKGVSNFCGILYLYMKNSCKYITHLVLNLPA